MSANFIDGNKFVLGANLAWLDDQYDHDFGNNEIVTGNIPAYNNTSGKTNFCSYLQDMKDMGIQVVRCWVFERFEGLKFNSDGSVKQVDSTLVENLAYACKVAADIGVKFYLCLMDTWGIWQNKEPQKQKWLDTMNGLITMPDKTNSFINNAVIPLISNETIKERIFAVDVINEPEGFDREKTKNDSQYPTDTQVTWEQIMTYIKTCATTLKDVETGLQISCGFQCPETLQNNHEDLADCLNFFDFHKYDDNGDIPAYSSLGIDKPCIIGECGQKTKQWNEQYQINATTLFLNNALSRGYAGCFVWNYNFKNFDITKKDTDYYTSLINSDGSHRPVCSVISNFAQNLK